MKITVCPADTGGCGHYRMIWPAEALRAQGHDVEIRHFSATETPLCRAYYDAQAKVVGVELLHETDVLVLQRVLKREMVEVIPFLQKQGVAVVVEIDDDFTCIHPRNQAYEHCDPAKRPDHNWQHLQEACRIADLVTVSTPALARRFAPHGRVEVLPNCIPRRYLDEPHIRRFAGDRWREGKKAIVGWAGSIASHPDDLQATGGGVARALGGLGQFHVIGTGEGVADALGLDRKPTNTGWVSLGLYPRALARLDVGIVPLRRSAFNRAKSWLKGLEMAAVGVPFVASNTPEYERLAQHGAGVLAARPADWQREVSKLVRDAGWRAELAARGSAVARQFVLEDHAIDWLAAWTVAATIRRAA